MYYLIQLYQLLCVPCHICRGSAQRGQSRHMGRRILGKSRVSLLGKRLNQVTLDRKRHGKLKPSLNYKIKCHAVSTAKVERQLVTQETC